MACSNSTYVQNLRDRLSQKEATHAKLVAVYDDLLDKPIKEYSLNTTEANQKVKRRELVEVRDALDALEAEIDQLRRRLCGLGVHAIRLRRK